MEMSEVSTPALVCMGPREQGSYRLETPPPYDVSQGLGAPKGQMSTPGPPFTWTPSYSETSRTGKVGETMETEA